jgi:quercetin dioxygenase-like cupin family protein
MTARTTVCSASGIEEKRHEWTTLDPGEDPSRGAQLAVLGGEAGVAVLLVDLEPGGLIALHSSKDASICHVIEGDGTLFFAGGDEIDFARGDTIEFAPDVAHGWNGGRERALILVATYSGRHEE